VATGRAGTERVLQADAVVISLPLGVLKANAVAFDPPLPLRKQHAIDRLGFGILNKVLLGFDVAFWKDREGRRDFWGIAAKTSRQRGQAFQFWNMTRCTGHPLLLVLHAGRSAVLPGSDAEAARAAVGATMDALRSIFGQGVVPEPTSQQVTRWEHDPFALGVYSHVAVGASALAISTSSRAAVPAVRSNTRQQHERSDFCLSSVVWQGVGWLYHVSQV